MKEIFISHSSCQKDFAKRLREEIGNDRCIIDCADFDAAKKSGAEITRWFNESKIFVLLLSVEALSSEWVQYEIDLAKQRFYSPKRKNTIFLPIIVDERISHVSEEIPDWIREEECFNLKLFRSPVVLSHLVLKELRELIWKSDEKTRLHDSLFVGRKKELAEFEKELNGKVHPHLNGAIITGRMGIGKHSFARQCIISELKESPAFEPYKMTMREKDDIENFILQLNDFLQYPKVKIEEILSSSTQIKLNAAVRFTNELYSHKAYVLIADKMGCVGYDGRLTDWFKDFISHPELIKELKIFVLSEIQWVSYEAQKYQNLININLKVLTTEERVMLFNRCCDIFEVCDISNQEVLQIVRKLTHSPGQIVNFVKDLKVHPYTKKLLIEHMVEDADNSIRTIIDPFIHDRLAIDLLLVLSRFEFLSYRLLQVIFSDRITEMETEICEMIDFNLIEEFGFGDSYVRLDAAIADYMLRSRFKLDSDTLRIVEEVSENLIQNETDIDDMSSYLIEQRQILKHQINGNDKFKILIPSVAIKYVIDLYYDRKYDSVINLCTRLLEDMHNFYPQIIRELSYWLAMCYARKGNRRELDSALSSLSDVDRYFILGFYYRRKGDFDKALEYLEKANRQYYDTNKVRRELVEVYMRMGNIEDALDLAKINYDNRPDNVFHIQAYFQCLNAKPIRTAEDIALQQRLLSEMERSNARNASSMLAEMKRQFTN